MFLLAKNVLFLCSTLHHNYGGFVLVDMTGVGWGVMAVISYRKVNNVHVGKGPLFV